MIYRELRTTMLFVSRFLGFLYVLILPVASVAQDSGISMFANAGLSSKTIYYDFVGREASNRLIGATARLGVAVSDFYVAMSYETTIDDDAELEERGAEVSADRKDRDITVGYTLSHGFTVFAGMKNGATTLKQIASADVGADPDNENGIWYFRERGPFAGLSYQWNINNENGISFSIAHAKLDYEADLEATITGGEIIEAFTGSASGNSYGIGWSRKVDDNTLFTFDIKYTRYDINYDWAPGWGYIEDSAETYKSIGFGALTFF